MRDYVCCASCRKTAPNSVVRRAKGIPSHYANASFADFPDDKADKVRRMTKQYTMPLLIWGAAHIGKTHMLCAMAKDAAELGIDATFVPFVEWCGEIKRAIDTQTVNDVLSAYQTCGALFLDDLLMEGNGAFIDRLLYELYNYRHNHELPTYTTMNLNSTDDLRHMDDRLRWRLNEGGAVIYLKENYRK